MLEEKLDDFTPTLIYKKLYSLSKILRNAGANINLMFRQRNQKIGIARDETLINEHLAKQILYEKMEILTMINKFSDTIPEDKDIIAQKIIQVRDLQKKLKECVNPKETIIFDGYAEVKNFNCLMEEKLLFSMYAEEPNVEMKFSFINKINEIYFKRKTKEMDKKKEFAEDNFEIAEITQSIATYADLNIELDKKEIDELVLRYLTLFHLNKEMKKRVVNSWIFRYQALKYEKYIQVSIDWIFLRNRQNTLLYEDPILKNSLKFDYEQILDFNFKYVLGNFSKSKWFDPNNEEGGRGQFKNKKKLVRFYNSIMYYVILFTRSKTNYHLSTSITMQFLKVLFLIIIF